MMEWYENVYPMVARILLFVEAFAAAMHSAIYGGTVPFYLNVATLVTLSADICGTGAIAPKLRDGRSFLFSRETRQ
jgi:hypothetical protein